MSTPTGTGGGTIDVTPAQLYSVSDQTAALQDPLNLAAQGLLDSLGAHPDCGGYGPAAQGFATTYKEIADTFLDTWGKMLVSVGGAAAGFTTTANNYVTSDAAGDPTGHSHASPRALPTVIDRAPAYGPVTDLRWNDVDASQNLLQILEEGGAGIEYTVAQLALSALSDTDQLAAVLPLPDYQGLNSLADAWNRPAMTLGMVDSTLTGLLSGITDQSNSEWYGAMRRFCSALWGTTAWGRPSVVTSAAPGGQVPDWSVGTEGHRWKHDSGTDPTSSHPILGVLTDTGTGIGSCLTAFAEAAKTVRDATRAIFRKAIDDVTPDLHTGSKWQDVKNAGGSLVGIVADIGTAGSAINVDGGAIDAAVAAYNEAVNTQTAALKKLLPPLKEAALSAPTFNAEEARAEGFGSRALTEFKKAHYYTVPGGDPSQHEFPIDLASEEGMDGAHSLDKHVGKTDEQLAQRLRDQNDHNYTETWRLGRPRIAAASSFSTEQEAQRFTQFNIDTNSTVIKDWINSPHPSDPTAPANRLIIVAKGQDTTGSSITKQQFKASRMSAHSTPAPEIDTRLRWDADLDPPFAVITSMPKNADK